MKYTLITTFHKPGLDQYAQTMIDTFEKYSSLKSNLKYIKSNDRFYNDKFLKLKFKFPYSFVFFRNLKHKISRIGKII